MTGFDVASETLTLLREVVARSPDARQRALAAIRALTAESPVLDRRLASVATEALADASAEWTDQEQTALADWATAPADRDDALTPEDESARQALSDFLTEAGIPLMELSRLLGRDARSARRWFAGQQRVPRSLADQIERLRVIAVTPTEITLAYRR